MTHTADTRWSLGEWVSHPAARYLLVFRPPPLLLPAHLLLIVPALLPLLLLPQFLLPPLLLWGHKQTTMMAVDRSWGAGVCCEKPAGRGPEHLRRGADCSKALRVPGSWGHRVGRGHQNPCHLPCEMMLTKELLLPAFRG